MAGKKYKRIVVLIPEDVYPFLHAVKNEKGFASMSSYVRFVLMRELERQAGKKKKRGKPPGGV